MSQRAKARRKEREKQKRRNQQVWIIGGAAVVAVLVLILAIVANQPSEAPLPENILTRYQDLPQSLTEDGYPMLGDPDAPVRVEEFSSFSCPGCAQFDTNVFPSLVERVRAGEISFTYIPMRTGSIPNPDGAARTGLCAAQQGRFWEMHETLFLWHNQLGNQAFTNNRLLAGVEALGLNRDEFNTCFSSDEINQVLNRAQNEGVGSTPTVRVNGSDVAQATLEEVNTAIDNALALSGNRNRPPTPEPAETAEPESTPETEAESTPEATDQP